MCSLSITFGSQVTLRSGFKRITLLQWVSLFLGSCLEIVSVVEVELEALNIYRSSVSLRSPLVEKIRIRIQAILNNIEQGHQYHKFALNINLISQRM